MKISKFVFNPFGENTYVAWDPASKEAAIIDPGMMHPDETKALTGFIAHEGLKVRHLVNTHLHIDHACGNAAVKRLYNVDTQAGEADRHLGAAIPDQAKRFGLGKLAAEPVSIDRPLADGVRIPLGHEWLEVIPVPGHSPGSIALYNSADGWVITGDALFAGSIGRTDLPGGDHPTLLRSIRQRLFTLPPQTTVLPGHGPETTIEAEIHSNPYF